MKVALTAEGTYPHQFGGVSVWCDQLVRGLTQHEFTLVPIVATGNEPIRWQPPANVTSVVTIPLWGRPPSVPWRARLSRGRNDAVLSELIDVLLRPPAEAPDRFTDVMRELFSYAQARNLQALLASETAVSMLSEAWRQRWPQILPSASAAGLVEPTLADAVTAMQLLEHALRPLSHPPVQVDLLHAATNGLGALPALTAKWQYGTPMIVTEHGVYMREHYLHLRRPQFGWPVKDLYLRFLRRLCTLGYREAEAITPGNIYNKRWETELGADPARVRTVYNGVDPAVFPVLSSEPEVPTISWVGRIDPVKDLETLLRAFSLVLKEIPQARLRIFGSAPPGGEAYLESCRAEAADLGLGQQVTFEGRVPEIRDAYAAGHIVVLCSISEGFPYTLIEAMACGRACVATDVGGVSEAIGSVAGSIVPPRNPAALAHACIELLRDDKLRQTMGAAARARAVEHFTVDRAISAFDEMYTLLGGVPAAAGAADAALETVAGAGPQADVPAAEAGTATQPNRWIALPPEEECTVVMPRTELSVKAAARSPVRPDDRPSARPPVRPDEEITQVVPVFGGGLAGADPDSTVILPRQRLGWMDPADEDRTVIMPRQIREYGAPPETAAPQAPAEPPADELTEAAR
jgi:glycosyltransferase involved in cell wall biosynthesis